MSSLDIPQLTKTVNFTHKRADTFEHTFLVKDRSDKSAIDFGVGATAEMVFTSTGSPSTALTLSTANSKITLDTSAGSIAVSSNAGDFDHSETTLSYTLRVTHADGGEFTYYEGTFTLED